MQNDYLTKQEFQDFVKGDFANAQKDIEELKIAVKKNTEGITRNGVLLEDIRDHIKAMAELLTPNLERSMDHESRITENTERIDTHDLQIHSLLKNS